MKRTIPLLFLLLAFLPGFSQSLVDQSKTWSNIKIQYLTWQHSSEHFRFGTDTLIEGATFKKIERSVDPLKATWSPYGYAREDTLKRVYYKYQATDPEQLLYNFSVQPGDTVMACSVVTFENFVGVYPQPFTVISVDSMLIGETYRKRINLSIPDTDSDPVLEQWIDSTGNTGGFLRNFSMSVGRDDYQLLCFSEYGEVKYLAPGNTSCNIVTGAETFNGEEFSVVLAPNPVTSQSVLTVRGQGSNETMQVGIYDLKGSRVFSGSFTRDIPVNGDDFQPGIYYYLVTGSDGHVFGGKMIRQ